MGGIYKLEWEQGYFYYGQTQSFIQRKSSHLSRLKNGTHNNRKISRIYKKYGVPKFLIIENCDNCEYNNREQFYLNLSKGNKFCCNIEMIATGARGMVRSKATRLKISLKHKGKTLTAEHKKAISEGGLRRKEKGYKQPKKYGKDNHYFGKKHSEEIRIKMRKSKNVGENNSKAKIVLNLETGIYYGCGADAAKSISIKPSSLQQMLVGYRKNKTSFIYV